MKPLHYVRKYKLNEPNHKFNHSEFIADLTTDFMTLLEVGKATENIKGFENAVRAMRMKWDAINNKTIGNLPYKLWNYYYATVVAKFREKLFPEVVAERKREKQEYEKRKKERERTRREYDPFFNMFFGGLFDDFLTSIFEDIVVPKESFNMLGIEATKDEDIIKTRYRELAMIHHPDKGGSRSKFEEITEAKNRCLLYCKN